MNLNNRLHDLSQDLTAQIIDIIRDLTLEELLELVGEKGEQDLPKPKTRPRPKARKKRAVSAPKQSAPPVVEETKPEPPPKPKRKLPPREPSVPSYRKEIEARLEKAIYDFIVANPGADAGLVSMKIGIPVAKAQGVLDGFVMKGNMRMTSGERGRCYWGVGE